MPRIVWKDTAGIDIHYGSPHEFVKDIVPGASPERLFVQAERLLPRGSRHAVTLHIGFINRQLHLKARVEDAPGPAPARMILALLGPDGSPSAELHNLIQQIEQGLACEAATGAMKTTGERVPRERQLQTMPTTLKLILARKAGMEDRLVLAGDVDPRIIEFLLKNPDISLPEIRSISARPTINTLHIRTILANRAWNGDAKVRLNLARNPRLPDMLVDSLLESLTVEQLQIVAMSATITLKTKRVAHRLLQSRGR